ncbi:MAG: TrkH family potassium uptake protein [Actinobacteria bacterium]|nr:TrkH family potassium uptake protein [Actinomycetota bacterium]
MRTLFRRTRNPDWGSLSSAVVTGAAVGGLGASALALASGLFDLTGAGGDAPVLLSGGIVTGLASARLLRKVRRPRRHETADILTGVTVAFLAMVLVGTFAYLLTGTLADPGDALFEAAAGFSTTALSTLDVDTMGRGMLLFRAGSQWVGGLTALILGVAILPALSADRELADRRTGSGRTPLAPSGGRAAGNVLRLYAGFTLLLGIGYLLAGAGPLGSVLLAASTASTGGFVGPGQPLTEPAVQWVAILGMFVAGASMVILWRLVTLQWQGIRRSAEFRTYLLLLTGGTLLLGWWSGAGGPDQWRETLFTLLSAATTTGFPMEAVGPWATAAPVLLLLAAAVGPMTGSAGGGFQIFRMIGLVKLARRELMRQLHPSLIARIRIGGVVLSEAGVGRIVLQQFLFVAVVVATTGAVGTLGLDLATALTAGVHAAATAGPIRALDGTLLDPASWSRAVRLALVPAMIIGRLALYPALVAIGTAATGVRDRLRLRRRWAALTMERDR